MVTASTIGFPPLPPLDRWRIGHNQIVIGVVGPNHPIIGQVDPRHLPAMFAPQAGVLLIQRRS